VLFRFEKRKAVSVLEVGAVESDGTGTTYTWYNPTGDNLQLDLSGGIGTKLTILNSGNVGIGNSSPTAKLQITSTSAGAASVALFLNNNSATSSTETRIAFAANTNDDISTNRYSYISALNTSGSNGQALIFATNETGNAAVERLRIASTGAATFQSVNAKVNTGGWHVLIQDNTSMAAGVGGGISFNGYKTGTSAQGVYAGINGYKTNGTAGNELGGFNVWTSNGTNLVKQLDITDTGAATFTSSVTATAFTAGGAGSGGAGTLTVRNDGGIPASIANEAITGTLIRFSGNGLGVLGSISHNGTNVAYNTSSDYRLKEDLQEIKGLERVQDIKVYDYKWKSFDSRMDGVLAHELAEVLPYAVYGVKDEVDEDGNDKMQGVDYSKLVPIMIKAIQEQQAQIEELKLLIK